MPKWTQYIAAVPFLGTFFLLAFFSVLHSYYPPQVPLLEPCLAAKSCLMFAFTSVFGVGEPASSVILWILFWVNVFAIFFLPWLMGLFLKRKSKKPITVFFNALYAFLSVGIAFYVLTVCALEPMLRNDLDASFFIIGPMLVVLLVIVRFAKSAVPAKK